MREPGFVLSNTLLARQREKTWVLGSGFRLHYYGDKGAGWRVNREWNSKAGAVQDVHVGQPLRSVKALRRFKVQEFKVLFRST